MMGMSTIDVTCGPWLSVPRSKEQLTQLSLLFSGAADPQSNETIDLQRSRKMVRIGLIQTLIVQHTPAGQLTSSSLFFFLLLLLCCSFLVSWHVVRVDTTHHCPDAHLCLRIHFFFPSFCNAFEVLIAYFRVKLRVMLESCTINCARWCNEVNGALVSLSDPKCGLIFNTQFLPVWQNLVEHLAFLLSAFLTWTACRSGRLAFCAQSDSETWFPLPELSITW